MTASEHLMMPCRSSFLVLLGGLVLGCTQERESPESKNTPGTEEPIVQDTAASEDTADLEDSVDTGVSADTGLEDCEPMVYDPDPFADLVVSFVPGEGAGFGEEGYPDIVLGAPKGGGASAGSEDVLSLGQGGLIVLEFVDYVLVDGPGVDLLVFENPFPGWAEPARISASVDGVTWQEWPCDPVNAEEGFPGCAGVQPVLSHPTNCLDATDPDVAGGDGFDLSVLGLTEARFIKVEDANVSGLGGFDLDAVAIVNGVLE